ncbi:uncharacterized protein LOC106470297 [Limulus polyphemus]|uniref:Uncharacterized protein LOC106470297 n=1 Tax=Limulus polyphemus TaxID=6850 RepID=A0ABM1THS1_LIMPO|nr:uncharacterized protein LOC106470297 [Limulus polyphemus]XP_022255427.1 uncharacterized protein LOC106470297 [Limulus polyphemus]
MTKLLNVTVIIVMTGCMLVSASKSEIEEVNSILGSEAKEVWPNAPAQSRILSKLLGLGFGAGAVNSIYNFFSTATGILAAIGGGYLLHVLFVAIFGETFGLTTGYQYGIPSYSYAGTVDPVYYDPYQRSNKELRHNSLKLPSFDLQKFLGALSSINYPENAFGVLGIKGKECKEKTVCELEQFIHKAKLLPRTILKNLSYKIPGMKKYDSAISRGLTEEDCSTIYSKCSLSLRHMIMNSTGLAEFVSHLFVY